MKNQKGFSLIVLVITIVVMIILVAFTLKQSTEVLDESGDAREVANAKMDNEKIESIMTYEFAGNSNYIDAEIILKRIELSDDIQVTYEDVTYPLPGESWTLYLCKEDLEKAKEKTGETYKPFQDLTKSYLVNVNDNKYIRLVNDWSF